MLRNQKFKQMERTKIKVGEIDISKKMMDRYSRQVVSGIQKMMNILPIKGAIVFMTNNRQNGSVVNHIVILGEGKSYVDDAKIRAGKHVFNPRTPGATRIGSLYIGCNTNSKILDQLIPDTILAKLRHLMESESK